MEDKLAEFSKAQTITTGSHSAGIFSAGAFPVTRTGVPRNLGAGVPLYAVCVVNTALNEGTGDADVTVDLVSADDKDGTNPTKIMEVGVLPARSAAGVSVGPLAIPPTVSIDQPWLLLRYTAAARDLTAGKVDGYLTTDPSVTYAEPTSIPDIQE